MATPDARPDVTALVKSLESEAEWFGTRRWGDRGLRLHGEAACTAMTDAARRLTEQEAEIARLREENTRLLTSYGAAKLIAEKNHELAHLYEILHAAEQARAAAEQALTAARRERDALNAAAVAIVAAYGPHSDYDQPYRGMWLALQYAIRSTAASPGPAAPAGEDR